MATDKKHEVKVKVQVLELSKAGKYEEALEQFNKAVKLDPDHWQSRYNQAVVLGIDLKRYDDASRILAELAKLQPGNPDVARLAAEVDRRRKAAA